MLGIIQSFAKQTLLIRVGFGYFSQAGEQPSEEDFSKQGVHAVPHAAVLVTQMSSSSAGRSKCSLKYLTLCAIILPSSWGCTSPASSR